MCNKLIVSDAPNREAHRLVVVVHVAAVTGEQQVPAGRCAILHTTPVVADLAAKDQ